MYSTLTDAPVNAELVLLQVTRPGLAAWLQRLGLFPGGSMFKLAEEIHYHPVRVRGIRGDIVIPAAIAIKVFVHVDSGQRKPLVEMAAKEHGHVEAIACGSVCTTALRHLGVTMDCELSMIHALPHMDYITVIDRRDRTRLSEGEAASIWGMNEDGGAGQFYFARRNTPFRVEEVIGGRNIADHLRIHGVFPGCTLQLEAIAQAQSMSMHRPGRPHITVASPGGLRFYVSSGQAEEIIVKALGSTAPEGLL